MTKRDEFREELIKMVREAWPDYANAHTWPALQFPVVVPPVRNGGLTEGIITFTVDRVLEQMDVLL